MHYEELVNVSEDMFNEFIKCDETIIREYIGKLPLNFIQHAKFKNGIFKLKNCSVCTAILFCSYWLNLIYHPSPTAPDMYVFIQLIFDLG